MNKAIYNPMDQPVVEKILPIPHMTIRLVRPNNTFFVANRGGFKTTLGLTFYTVDCVHELPRSTGIVVGPSYEHLGDNTLNPLFNAFNEDGFEQGVHYVYGTKPPAEWPSPYIRVDSVKKYDHMISWHNGTNQFLISMAKKGAANGISAQWGIFDELKLLDQKELSDVIFPVFRGNEKRIIDDETHPSYKRKLSDSPLFMSKFLTTDKLADPAKIQWILDKRKMNDQRKIDIVITLQLSLNKLKDEYNFAGVNKRQKLKPQINAIEVRLSKLRKNLTMYIESDHTHTIQVLGEQWYTDKVNSLRPYERKVAIENQDPDRPEEGFYPDFNVAAHTHEIADDYNAHKPLIIAADYQHSVSPIAVVQVAPLPGEKKPSLNYINALSTVAPKGLADAVQLFCDTYAGHPHKRVYYVYDHTAKALRNDAEPYRDIVLKVLRRNGWRVVEVFTGLAPKHFNKYNDTKHWFENKDGKTMDIRLHRTRCADLIASISSAAATMKSGETAKDKKYEDVKKYPAMDQRRTTHFSDVFDMINHAVLKLNRIKSTSIMGGGLAFRK